MNPRCGVKISPYKHAEQNKERDFVLPLLTEYLLACERSEREALVARQSSSGRGNTFDVGKGSGGSGDSNNENGSQSQHGQQHLQLLDEQQLDDDYDINRHPHHGWQEAVLRLQLMRQHQ